MPAPIVAFVYNRPVHTRRMLESLAANALSGESELFIFAEGARPDASLAEKKQIEQTRQVIREKQWCGTVHIREATRNRGLAGSIVSGVTEILETYQKIIVLEDDLLLSDGFLTYMNEALDFYENTPQVLHISGYVYPIDSQALAQDTFFYEQASCWGWATWQRAWQFLETDPAVLARQVLEIPEGIFRFNLDDSYNFYQTILDNLEGRKKTWAVKWQASVFVQNGLCLHPKTSLVNNTGNDGTGVHQGFTNKYLHRQLAHHISIQPIPLDISVDGRELVKAFLHRKIPQKSLIPIALRQQIGKMLPSFVKRWLLKRWNG